MTEKTIPGYVRVPPGTTIQVRVPPTLRAQIEAYAKAKDVTTSAYIREILEEHVKPQK